MPRTGKRQRLARGIYRDGPDGPYELRVVVGGTAYYDRLPPDSTPGELQAAYARLVAKGKTETPKTDRWSLAVDAKRYLRLIHHLATADDREDHLRAWCALYGERPRHRLTAADVLAARTTWRAAGTAPKTINHRCDTLRNLFHRLDGKRAPTPVDDVPHLPTPKMIIQRVPDALMRAVDAALAAREQDPTKAFDGAKTRARFRVFVSTGKRPCEIMRAQPGDVDLKARVWVPRDAKGGYTPGVYLNDDMLAAWKLFIQANAWGAFNHGSFARVIRNAGWPANVRLYQARHTFGIMLSEAGIDLADVGTMLGHTDGGRTTRRNYVPILQSRLQRASEAVSGRFGGWSVGPKSGTAKRTKQTRAKSGR